MPSRRIQYQLGVLGMQYKTGALSHKLFDYLTVTRIKQAPDKFQHTDIKKVSYKSSSVQLCEFIHNNMGPDEKYWLAMENFEKRLRGIKYEVFELEGRWLKVSERDFNVINHSLENANHLHPDEEILKLMKLLSPVPVEAVPTPIIPQVDRSKQSNTKRYLLKDEAREVIDALVPEDQKMTISLFDDDVWTIMKDSLSNKTNAISQQEGFQPHYRFVNNFNKIGKNSLEQFHNNMLGDSS